MYIIVNIHMTYMSIEQLQSGLEAEYFDSYDLHIEAMNSEVRHDS